MKWRCVWCGREHEENDPPCATCGHETFERIAETSGSPFESESYAWVCPNCNREHVKNVGLCARCSHPSLERREADTRDLEAELSAPSYLSAGWPYAVGIVAVLAVVALAVVGILPVPGVGGPPAPPDAPGSSTQAAGLDLGTVEADLYERFTAERGAERTRDDGLDALATYLVRHEVAIEYDPEYDGDPPDVRAFDPACESSLSGGAVELDLAVAEYDDESSLADSVAAALLERPAYNALITGDERAEAIAVHATPENTVFVGYVAC